MADLFLLHGENIVQSRRRLVELREKLKNQSKESVKLDGEKVSLGEIKQALEAKSLFGDRRLVILENLLSSPASKRQKEIVNYFLKEKINLSLIVWEKKEIRGVGLTKLKSKFKIEIFKIPALIFKLLDSLKPDNSKAMISLFHQIDQKEPEFIFHMLCQRIRQLILAKDLGKKGLEGLQGWQQARLLNQTANFKLSQLLGFYHQLLEIDYQQKTSQTPFGLFSTLDLLFASL